MVTINEVTELSVEDGVAVVTIDSPPVNALSPKVRNGLHDGVKAALADERVTAVVVICAGRTFIAGADIGGFDSSGPAVEIGDVRPVMEAATKPVVAAIHGTALGGGLEHALCAHYRVAVPSAKCGLPEINLGLLPGGGGTQRFPRVVGVEQALELMTSGEHIPADRCLTLGLIDEIVREGHLREDAIAFAKRIVAEGRPLTRVRDRNEKVEAARSRPELFDEFRKANARRFRGFIAPEYIIRCIEAAVNLPIDEGFEVEARLFSELVRSEQSAAQRHLFFAEREVWKIPDVPADTPSIPVERVGIIGAGTMGGGIAMNFVNAGIPVTIIETSREALDRGLGVVRSNYERSARNGRFPLSDVDRRMALISPSLDLTQLADADLVIEAVFENMDVKKELFAKLDAIVKQGAILATNTSALNIDEIASATKRPDVVIGLHFFSPANVMRLLEVVRADHTSKPVINTSMQIAKKIGKVAALVGVCPGFVGNRMLAQRGREAQALLLEGAMPWDVDKALYDFGFAMGPFQMSDLAGLDIGWRAEASNPGILKDRLCDLGRKGQKTGAGYYDYDANRVATPSPVTAGIVEELARAGGMPQRSFTADEIVERLVFPMINEGAKILDEKKAIRPSDIDVIWVLGYNWPRYRGGPMFYADQLGLPLVLETIKRYEKDLGAAWKPAALLERLVAEGRSFKDLRA